MRRADIQNALEAARSLTNHTEFVVAGSLSVLGWVELPPEAMSVSIDIDFFMLGDPQRSHELAVHLGEGSAFHRANGYYLDPITPELPTLPRGWRGRVKQVQLGQVSVLFLDVNDIAISKYVRGDENDFRWIEAGYRAGILDLDTIKARMVYETNFYEPEEKWAALSRVRLHELARQVDGLFAEDLLVAYSHYRDFLVKDLDLDQGSYSGEALWASREYLMQEISDVEIGVHKVDKWESLPEIGARITIDYVDGAATWSLEEKSLPPRER